MLDRLMSSEWSLVIIQGNELVKHAGGGFFRETGTLYPNDRIPGVRWNLNDTGNTIQLALHNGNVYLCEIFIHFQNPPSIIFSENGQ